MVGRAARTEEGSGFARPVTTASLPVATAPSDGISGGHAEIAPSATAIARRSVQPPPQRQPRTRQSLQASDGRISGFAGPLCAILPNRESLGAD
mmetsp:Transcript_9982/g.38821  ORF Transcript_9982/g.38821 Transcript_9982/m.38821 type:complete len:94 (-) Transcript_9982:663-944(-)